VIAESTRKLVGNLFELEDLGAQDLKGITGPVRTWAALRASSAEGRFEAMHPTGLTELVGREEELEILLRRWSKAKNGQGQVALLSGEPGIGKSRLTAAFLERLTPEPHVRLRYFCSPQHTDSPLYPIISQMERAARFTHADTKQVKLDKLDAVLALASTSKQDAALLAEMLSLPNDGRYPALEPAPQQRRQKTLEALTAQLEALSRSNPVLMIFEDVHWIDPTSVEVLGRSVERLKTLGVLLIVTYRPEFEPPWIGRPYVTALSLNRLGEREIASMIESVAGNKPLPESVRQDIIERTDGIPLFVEEMTKAVLEVARGDAAECTVAATQPSSIPVPASLHASLMARLDRLGPAKEVAQVGAAIGRGFSHALLAAVVAKAEAEITVALDRLVTAGLLFRQGVSPHATYLFKHAWCRMLRMALCCVSDDARFMLALPKHWKTSLRTSQSDSPSCWRGTAPKLDKSRKLRAYGPKQGIVHWNARRWPKLWSNSHALWTKSDPCPLRLNFVVSRSSYRSPIIGPLIHVKGYAAPESKAAAERASQLIEQAEECGEPLDDPLLLFSTLYGLWVANYAAFNGDMLCALAKKFLALAQKKGTTEPLLIGHRLMGVSLIATGNIAEGRTHLDRAFALYDHTAHASLGSRFGQDARVSILSYRSLALWLLGYPEAALTDVGRALIYAREIKQAPALMYVLFFTSFAVIYCGDYLTAKSLLDELTALAAEKEALQWKANGMMQRGWVLALTGEAMAGSSMIASGLTASRSTGAAVTEPLCLSNLAATYAKLGRFNDASRRVGEAIRTIEPTKEKWFDAEVNRIAGEIELQSPEPDTAKAETYFKRALTVAREQQAKSWELRAAMSLARLWRDQGKVQQARELLAPVYGWFTEGFDTRDLKEAKALLRELMS
jgi:predicted ATPase